MYVSVVEKKEKKERKLQTSAGEFIDPLSSSDNRVSCTIGSFSPDNRGPVRFNSRSFKDNRVNNACSVSTFQDFGFLLIFLMFNTKDGLITSS